jgi:capsular exopolysaccharide synthesis family protein
MRQLEFTRFEPLDYACTEAFNTLCVNLSFVGSNINKMMVTSSQSSEGKSFLAMNMMRTMAKLGKSVVLVDADLRRSPIASRFGMQPSGLCGLAHYLAGKSDAESVLYATNMEGAYMVPAGRSVANSLPLLNTPRLARLLDWLSKRFDMVLIDAPPVGTIIDAAEIAKSCDGTLFVVSWNKVGRRELNDGKRQIERAGCRVLGTVLNNVSFDSFGSKKYYNRSYYAQ